MPQKLPIIRSQDKLWNEMGKTKGQKRRLRYYYRNRDRILMANKSPFTVSSNQ